MRTHAHVRQWRGRVAAAQQDATVVPLRPLPRLQRLRRVLDAEGYAHPPAISSLAGLRADVVVAGLLHCQHARRALAPHAEQRAARLAPVAPAVD